jgi:hypothetical protein
LAGDYAEAIEVLEAKGAGPLALVETNHAAVSQKPFVVEVMKTALQAFALVSPPQQEKAGKVLEALEKALAPTKEGATQLTQIYLGLGLQLKLRLEELRAAGAEQEARQVAAGFAGLLDRLTASEAGNDWNARLWTAHTYYEVGQAIAAADRQSTLAQSYLEKSLAAYARLLELAKSDAQFAPNERAVLAVRKRQADVLREMGQFREAMDIYSAILTENAMMLDVQRDAAYAYQLWGEEDARRFENAIFGGRRVKSTSENLVWGWIKLSRVAAQAARQDAKYRDWYFEARLNAAESRYLAALAAKGEDRTSQLQKAKSAIRALHQFHPEMGSAERQQEFDKIQDALHEPVVGLKEFDGVSE